MQELRAQVTSSLLQFSEVTIQALGEDEITLDSLLHGKFTTGRNGLAWLACGPQLEVANASTGERLSAYHFSGVTEQPPTVLAVKEFSWQKRTGLLVGLEEAEGSALCLYDLGISRVVKAIVLPGRVTAIEPITDHGGASASTQHLHQCVRWFFGVAAVVTDVGHVLLIDLCLDDLSCSQDELEASDLEVITGIPAEIPRIREAVTRERRHLCLQLLSPSGTRVSTLCYISRTNHLAVGFSDGYLSLWNMKTLKREYHFQLEGGRVPIYAVNFQEPENDPRNCCYLWAVQSTQESEGDLVSLHLLQLAFCDRKCSASGQILYEGLEYCEERYSLDLTCGNFSLRGQTSNTKLLSFQTVEKFRSHGERDESMTEATSPDTSVSVFCWQVNTYGQGKPSTYLGVFDINRWYHAQMPDSLRPGEFLHNCPYFALWSLDAVVSMTSPHYILDILVHERSLNRGVPPSYPPPEQFFNPSTYNFDATCLLNSGIIHITCTGFQKETLQFLKKSGPSLSETIPDGYHRCLVAGLLSPRLADVQPSILSQEEQLQAILSAAVETSSLGLLTGCIKQWTAEELPGSSANLRFVLEWTWNKVVCTKEELDRICASLFDGSCNFIDLQTLQSLQHCHLLLSNLGTVLNCFVTEAQELTERGFVDLTNKQLVTSLISQYAEVVLWFCRCGLLPENFDDEMQLSRPFYNYRLIQNYYTGRRQKLERLSRRKWNSDCLMIDGMLSQLGDGVDKLWSRDEGGTGKYPPATLHALLDLYLLQNVEESSKHAITIYLLLDIMYSFPNKTETSVESFPTAFAVPWGLVKLIQGFWLMDHNDHENSLDRLFHPSTSKSMLSWQHTRIIQALMCQGEHRQALRYIQMMTPPMNSSSEVTLHLTVFLFNRRMVEAWSLLRLQSNRLNVEDLLKHMYEVCQEIGLMEDLLRLPFTSVEQECLEKFLKNSTDVQNQEFLLIHHLQRANYIPALQLNQSLKTNVMNDRDPRLRERMVARNSILDQYGKVLPRVQRKLASGRVKPYSLSSSILREAARPKPLSTVAKPAAAGNVFSKATFINNVLSKIGEIWVGNAQSVDSSPNKSVNTEEQSPRAMSLPELELPDAFVGTPITKSSHRISRLLDSVVHPVRHTSKESNQHTPIKAATYSTVCSPVQLSLQKSTQLKSISRASELNLLETPPVVRRAKALVTSRVSSAFSGFTPQSILRSSLRTTPLASPSASPGRSVTPPSHAKETKISFLEEQVTAKWTSGVLKDSRTKCLLLESPVPKSGVEIENLWSSRRGKDDFLRPTYPMDDLGERPTYPVDDLGERPIYPVDDLGERPTYPVDDLGERPTYHVDDHGEMNESSSDIQDDSPKRLEISKDISDISVRSDQTTLEFHDARTPENFGDDDVFITSKPTNSPSQEPAALEEQHEENKSTENALHINQQKFSETQERLDKVTEIRCLAGPENEPPVFQPLNTILNIGLATCLPVNKSQESAMSFCLEEKMIGKKVNTGTSLSTAADIELISIPDTEEITSTDSENRLEEENDRNLNKDQDFEVEMLEEKILSVVDQNGVSIGVAKSQELHVITENEHEMHLEAATLGTEYEESHVSGTLKLQHNFDSIEQHFTCCLADTKDTLECEMDDDRDLLDPPNNFTLTLEEDKGETEQAEIAAINIPTKVISEVTEESLNYVENIENLENIKNSLSFVDNTQEHKNIVDTLPYVPEPIKVAIAENLLDVIKDTRSKDFTVEMVEQSVNESIHLKSRCKKSSYNSLKTPLKITTRSNSDDMNVSHVDEWLNSVHSLREKSAKNQDDHSTEILLTKENKQEQVGLSTPRRSTRRIKGMIEEIQASSPLSREKTKDHPISQILISTKRGSRTTSESISETLEKPQSSIEESQITTSKRGSKKTETLVLPEELPQTKLLGTPKKGIRELKNLLDIQESNHLVMKRVQIASTPRSHRKKSKDVTVENYESVSSNVQEQDIPVVLRRGRSGAMEMLKKEHESSKLLLHQVPTTPRRSSRRGVLNEAGVKDSTIKQEHTISTPKKRSRRLNVSKIDITESAKPILDETMEQPTEEFTVTRPSRRKLTKMNENQSRKSTLPSVTEETTLEERLHKSPESKERLYNTNSILFDECRESLTNTRITRTRSSSVLQHFTEKSFTFSPPSTRLKKKKSKEPPAEIKALESDVSSQFYFSSPATRTRRKHASSLSEIGKGMELTIEENKEIHKKATEEKDMKKVTESKTKSKMKAKATGKEVLWSPPPVEIKLISPLPSPVDGTTNKAKPPSDPSEKMTLRKNRKRLMLKLSKPVTRRKML
uniref:Protein ELYS isoform X2 n=1 Tax=Geotrypetes seraphini TaxID=260995 RepID=A0A6P8PVM9_GEOSA|nr:protein ELYS isoform X2 [Geotrypetes seraphini]